MADKNVEIGVNLIGKDISASETLKKIGKEAENTGGAFAKIKTIAAGVFSGNLMTSAVNDVTNFAKESINAFQDVGTQVKQLQRYTGGTAEDMSKLRFAAEESGVSTETLALALGKMAKAAGTVAGEKKFAALGIQVKDASGQFKSSTTVLTEVADKISKMPNGIAKTSAIMTIFGRSGMQLAPLLNQGAAGIAKFSKEAEKMGLVLSQGNLDAVQKNIMAQREFHASVQGLQVQLGQYLYPAITAITKGFSEIVPVLTTVLKPAFQAIGRVLVPIVNIIQQVAKYIVDLGTNFVSTGGHASMFAGIGKSIGTVFSDVKKIFEVLLPILEDWWKFVSTYLFPILLDLANVAFKAIAVGANIIVDAIKLVINIFKGFVTVIKDIGIAIKDIFGFIVSGFKLEINGIIELINIAIRALDKIHVKLPSFLGGFEFGINIPEIPKLAEGGIVTSPTLAMIGEAGAEAVVPLSKGGFGQGMNVTINVQGSVIAQKDLVLKVRDELGQLLRRKGAPTAALGI
jgi:hypothetical protein